jgi:pyrrolysine biosynthesis protein PylC
MRIVVAGGGLQGTEAAYLARQAGWEITLIDRKESAPASGLCDQYVRLDLTDGRSLDRVLERADFVIPALENQAALDSLEQAAGRLGIPLAYDAAAYAVTVSKRRSDALFAEHGIPAPQYWPCALPVIAKPSGSSGSKGVRLISQPAEIERLLTSGSAEAEQWVVQEYLPGDSYSIEVLGCRGHYLPLQVTDLGMDADYDCRRVTAPTRLPPAKIAEFQDLAVKLAGLLNLKGIMDVEVIDHGGRLKVLEIDARLPSQTPATVFHSAGINMLTLLYDIFALDRLPPIQAPEISRAVIYEHVLVEPDGLQVLGEHIISTAGRLRLERDFFGANEAITDYFPGAGHWVATLIFEGGPASELWTRRSAAIASICRQSRLPLPALDSR